MGALGIVIARGFVSAGVSLAATTPVELTCDYLAIYTCTAITITHKRRSREAAAAITLQVFDSERK